MIFVFERLLVPPHMMIMNQKCDTKIVRYAIIDVFVYNFSDPVERKDI